MLTKNNQKAVEDVVTDNLLNEEMFTAGEIVDIVREQYPNPDSYLYAEVRNYVHSLYSEGRLGVGYGKTAVSFDTLSNGRVSAYVYHPMGKDPHDYRSHEFSGTDKKREVKTPSHDPLDDWNRDLHDPLDDGDRAAPAWACGDPVDLHPVLPAVPSSPCFTGDTVTPLADGKTARIDKLKVGDELLGLKGTPSPRSNVAFTTFVSTSDIMGTVILDNRITSLIVPSPRSTVYAIPEHKRLTLVGSAAAYRTNATLLTTEDDGSLRIPSSLFTEANVVGDKIKITMEDDALFLTGKR